VAGFVKRPGFRTLGFGTSKAGSGLRSTVCPAESGTQVGALPPVRKELRFREASGRTGLRPGSCEAADQRRKSKACRAGLRLRPKLPAGGEPELRLRLADGGTGTPVPALPSGEPSGLRPCRGARGETLKELRLRKDPGGSGPGPRPGHGLETAQRTASPPRLGIQPRRDVGAGGNASPHFLGPASTRHFDMLNTCSA
jgi:hypothetical protein